MKGLSLLSVECKKIRRTKIIFILLAAVVILWIPSILNSDMNFKMQAEGITPENNFLIQGLLGMAWFIFPSSMIVSTVLLSQVERNNRGILKMLSLPINTAEMCLAKFTILLFLAAVQVVMMTVLYYMSAFAASWMCDYEFVLSPAFVCKEAGILYLAAIPMISVFWMFAVCIKTPVFAIGIGMVSIVPSVLVINTSVWYMYPMAYPFYVVTSEYGKLAEHLSAAQVQLFPWIPIAVTITILCLIISCLSFGRAERR